MMYQRFHEYCNPRLGVIVRRFQFHNSAQNDDTIDAYLMRLRRLAEGCKFEKQRDSLIRDKLLFGLDDIDTKRKLMRESDEKLTLKYLIKLLRIIKALRFASTDKMDRPPEINAMKINSNLSHNTNFHK